MVARSLAIFRVEKVVIYQDESSDRAQREALLLEKILRFQETPQYLRKHLFKMDSSLAYVGVLPPLRTPHHPNRANPEPGQLREGIVVESGAASMVDVGFDLEARVRAHLNRLQRVTVRITRVEPHLEGELVPKTGLHIYWGFTVSRENHALREIIEKGDQDLTICTSRKGTDVREAMVGLQARWRLSKRPLLLFGSPRHGVPEILSNNGAGTAGLDFSINMVPLQGVETVRTEEALLSTLAVLNLLEDS